jgi:hypothetical protein
MRYVVSRETCGEEMEEERSEEVMTRDVQLNLRMTKAERARLDRLARHYGIGYAALIRMLLRLAELRVKASKIRFGGWQELTEEEKAELRRNTTLPPKEHSHG